MPYFTVLALLLLEHLPQIGILLFVVPDLHELLPAHGRRWGVTGPGLLKDLHGLLQLLGHFKVPRDQGLADVVLEGQLFQAAYVGCS